MSLRQLLKQPFPHNPSLRNKLVMAVFFGLFIFGFLMIFKPFDLDQYDVSRLTWIAFVYGAITFSCVFIATGLVPFLFPDTFSEKNWTTGKEIVFTACIIFFVGLVNFLISPFLVDTSLSLGDAIWFQGITLAIGLLPVSIFVLLRQNQLLKKFSEEAAVIEQKLQERQTTNGSITAEDNLPSNKISFVGDYQNEHVELYADDLYFITSASNYIKLFHLQKEKLVYSILRSTMKKAEEVTFSYPNFFKCHRAYIINLDKVSHVEGNAQGYRVRIEGSDDLIPVSRNLSTEFSDKLLAFRKQNSGQ